MFFGPLYIFECIRWSWPDGNFSALAKIKKNTEEDIRVSQFTITDYFGESSWVLSFRPSRKEDEGQYKCSAYSKDGEVEERNYFVTVLGRKNYY